LTCYGVDVPDEASFAGMRVAIAGAGQGIGAACARAFAQRGARLLLCARTAADVEALARELWLLGADAHALAADVGTDAGARAFAEAAREALGGVDLGLICVGAAHRPTPLREADRTLLLDQLAANAVAPVLAAGALLRLWAREPQAGRDRHLLFLSSLVTRRPPLPGTAPYAAAKAALEASVRAFAEEAWPAARANALCLGAVATRLHEHAGTPRDEIARFPTPDEVAPLVLALAGPLGRALTGRAVDADALAIDPEAALRGDGRLSGLHPLQPLVHEADAGELQPEAEPGRRPSPRVRCAVRETAAALHRYPDPGAALAARLEEVHGAPSGSVALSGGGASELLERALRAFCQRGDEVVSPFPTFELLSALCSREGLRHRPVPSPRLRDGLFGPHAARPLLDAVGPRTRVVYVASPDNPTGASLPAEEESALQRSLPATVLLLIDEAWAGPPRPSALGRPGAQVVRLRSFSKLHGLAALRIGYALGAPEAIALLHRLQLPYPLGAPQLAAALAVLAEPERTRRAALLLARERARLAQGLRGVGLCVSESEAPVLLVRDPAARNAGRLFFALQAAGAAVQEAHWDSAAVVLALGSRAQNRRFLQACARAVAR
jgi:histidinol-phosphate aminotransferase